MGTVPFQHKKCYWNFIVGTSLLEFELAFNDSWNSSETEGGDVGVACSTIDVVGTVVDWSACVAIDEFVEWQAEVGIDCGTNDVLGTFVGWIVCMVLVGVSERFANVGAVGVGCGMMGENRDAVGVAFKSWACCNNTDSVVGVFDGPIVIVGVDGGGRALEG